MRGASGVFERIAHAGNERALANVIMDHGERLFDAQATGFYALSDDGRASEVHLRHLPDAFLDAYERQGRDIDPVLAWVARHHAPSHTSHALSDGEWMRTTLYREIGRRWGGDRYLLVPIVVDGAMVGTMNFARRLPCPTFDEADLARAAALSAHVSSRMTALRLTAGAARRWSAVLTPREIDVAEMVGKGLTNGEIARVLGISPNTVKKVLKACFHKLGCERRAELAGIVSTGPEPEPARPSGTRSGT